MVKKLRPVSDLKGIKPSSLAIALTGDGTWECAYVLPALVERFNGADKALLTPEAYPHVVRGIKTKSRFVGFTILQAIKAYAGTGVNKYLIIVDKEHSNESGLNDEVKRKLEEYGFQDVRSTSLAKNAVSVECRHGSHEICIRVTLSGQNKCIEENIAELISLELTINVKPNKNDICNILRGKNLDLKELLRRAKMDNISRSFPALCAALKSLEASYTP